MDEKLKELVNDSYRVLKVMYDNQVTIEKTKYCPLSQNDISKEIGVTKMTVCNIIKRLKEKELIDVIDARKYVLKDDVVKIIEQLDKINCS
jgi:Mn-dependent DtxR family transcriptional regulator